MVFIKIEPNSTYLNADHVLKFVMQKQTGKSSVPDQYIVTAVMDIGPDEFIRAFDTREELDRWMEEVIIEATNLPKCTATNCNIPSLDKMNEFTEDIIPVPEKEAETTENPDDLNKDRQV